MTGNSNTRLVVLSSRPYLLLGSHQIVTEVHGLIVPCSRECSPTIYNAIQEIKDFLNDPNVPLVEKRRAAQRLSSLLQE